MVYVKNLGYNSNINPGDTQSFEYILAGATADFPNSIELIQTRRKRRELDFNASFNISSSWGTNISGDITFTNISNDSIECWELEFASNFKITASYSSGIEVIETPTGYRLKGTYSKNLAAGSKIQLSFAGQVPSSSVVPKISEISASGVAVSAEILMSKDSDGDELADYFELLLGTNKYNPDTDGDGLEDGFEYNYLTTDLLLSDADGDGLSDFDEDYDGDGLTNGEEQLLGTRPDDKDTDGDNLSDGDEVNIVIQLKNIENNSI